jgi:hypothetical protein
MSEQSKTLTSGHWSREGDDVDQSQYQPLTKMQTYPEIKAQAGRKVSLDGILYIKHPLKEAHLMGVISSADPSRPVFIQTAIDIPIPLEVPVRVRGELAGEPWANAA